MRQTKLQKGKQVVILVIETGLALLPTVLTLGSPEWKLYTALDALAKESDLGKDFDQAVSMKCNAGTATEVKGDKKP